MFFSEKRKVEGGQLCPWGDAVVSDDSCSGVGCLALGVGGRVVRLNRNVTRSPPSQPCQAPTSSCLTLSPPSTNRLVPPPTSALRGGTLR